MEERPNEESPPKSVALKWLIQRAKSIPDLDLDSFDPVPYDWLIDEEKKAKTIEELSKAYDAAFKRGLWAITSLEKLLGVIKKFESEEIRIFESVAWRRAAPRLKNADGQRAVVYPLRSAFSDANWSFQTRPTLPTLTLEAFLGVQHIIPGLGLEDVLPISKLTLDRLRLYEELQIFRGIPRYIGDVLIWGHRVISVISSEGFREPFERWRLMAADLLSKRIPLKLADPEAHGALSRMIAGGDSVRTTRLPSLLWEQLAKESVAIKRRINRTRWLKTKDRTVAFILPRDLPLIEYWTWLKNGVLKDLETYVLEFEGRDRDTKAATAPELRGTKQGEDELSDHARRLERGHWPKPKVIHCLDPDQVVRERRMGHNPLSDEASFDEVDCEDLFDRKTLKDNPGRIHSVGRGADGPHAGDHWDSLKYTCSETTESARDVFDTDTGDIVSTLQPLLGDLGEENEVDPDILIETIKSALTGPNKQHWETLVEIVRADRPDSLAEARTLTRQRLGITPENERQIRSRTIHTAGVKTKQKLLDTIPARGHPLLRPDGTEMRVPSRVLVMLRWLNLLVKGNPHKTPQLNPAIYAVVQNAAGPAVRLVRVLGRDLSGPDRVACNCPSCRLYPEVPHL